MAPRPPFDSRFLKFLAKHMAVGFALALTVSGLIVATDFAGLWSLVNRSETGLIAFAAMTFLFFVTFAGAQVAFAILSMPDKDD